VNILDENVPDEQRELVRQFGIRIRQIGREVGRLGMRDEEIIPLLLALRRATLFTHDTDFSDPGLCHPSYCIVYLNVRQPEIASFVRRVLRHPRLDTKAKRMGTVVHASHAGLRVWRRHSEEETLSWPRRMREAPEPYGEVDGSTPANLDGSILVSSP
jgi:hypothetical protein